MSKSPVTVGTQGGGWDARRIAYGGGRFFFVTADGKLCSSDANGGKPSNAATILAEDWPIAPFAIAGNHIVVRTTEGGLTAYRLDGDRLGGAADLPLRGIAELAGDENWLYVLDEREGLHRVAAADLATAGQPAVVAETLKASRLAVSGDRIAWLDARQKLWLGHLENGSAITRVELLSDEWKSDVFSALGDELQWIDPDGTLKRGKKLAGNGHYVHFRNEALDWATTDWIDAIVRGPGVPGSEPGYYSSRLLAGSPTGVPYEPKHQEYWYSVEYAAYVQIDDWPYHVIVRAYMPKGHYFKVEERSKVAVLRYRKDVAPNNMIVEIEDM